jgi:hypothetical protein
MDDHDKGAGGDDDRIEKVRRRAHAIWLDQGMAHGRDQEHWREAEQEIAAEEAESSSPQVLPKADEPAESAVKSVGESSIKGAVEAPVKAAAGFPMKGAA